MNKYSRGEWGAAIPDEDTIHFPTGDIKIEPITGHKKFNFKEFKEGFEKVRAILEEPLSGLEHYVRQLQALLAHNDFPVLESELLELVEIVQEELTDIKDRLHDLEVNRGGR